MVPHAGVVRLVHQPRFVALGRSSRVLQMAPLSFDAATFEIWGALLNGGSLVIMPPGSFVGGGDRQRPGSAPGRYVVADGGAVRLLVDLR